MTSGCLVDPLCHIAQTASLSFLAFPHVAPGSGVAKGGPGWARAHPNFPGTAVPAC